VTEVWDAVIASRAIVLDEVASRHGRIAAVARLAQRSAEAASRLADLTVRGPGDASSAEHENRLRAARLEKERADQALALATAGLEDPRRPTTRGVRGISTVLPIRGALVAYLLYDREFPRPPGERDDSSPIAAVSSYAAFVVRAGLRDPRLVPLGAAADIDAAIDRWRQSIVPGSTWSSAGAALDDSTAGEALRRDVWDPIAAALGDDVERVIVVPDGALNLVNLAALPTGESRYLVESGPLFHYASAERDLYHARRERPSGQGLLALGGASFDETSLFASLRTGSGNTDDVIRVASATAYRGQRSSCADFQSMEFESLPGTVGEIDEIVELWRTVHGIGGDSPGTTDAADGTRFEQLSGAAANETAFKELAPRCRMLHVATHGFFLGGRCASVMEPSRGIGGLAAAPPPAGGSSAVQPTTPEEPSRQEREAEPVVRENPLLLSGLALAGANHRSAAGPDEEDGILTAEEIAALDLSGVEWAVLSACDTGVGDIRAGEGVFGLRRAFQVAGARTLIISLWSVDDESTRAWMTALYDARLGRRLDTAEAAREASLAVLEERRGAGHSTSPFFWAGFVAAGDWR
jgi:CHAT domain-containing protein